jgi:hypothetical protein
MTEQEFLERMKRANNKVKDGISASIIDMLPEDRELAATRFVGVDLGDGDDIWIVH